MPLCGARRDDQVRGDLPIGQAPRDKARDLALATGERDLRVTGFELRSAQAMLVRPTLEVLQEPRGACAFGELSHGSHVFAGGSVVRATGHPTSHLSPAKANDHLR
jgi:hypothetical protein